MAHIYYVFNMVALKVREKIHLSELIDYLYALKIANLRGI